MGWLQMLAVVMLGAGAWRFALRSTSPPRAPRASNQAVIWPGAGSERQVSQPKVNVDDLNAMTFDPMDKDIEEGLKELDYTPHPEDKENEIQIQDDPTLVKELQSGNQERAKLFRLRYEKPFSLDEIERRRLQQMRYAKMGIDSRFDLTADTKYNQFMDMAYGDGETEESLQAEMKQRQKNLAGNGGQSTVKKDESAEVKVEKSSTHKEKNNEVTSDKSKGTTKPPVSQDEAGDDDQCVLKLVEGASTKWSSCPKLPRALNCKQYAEAMKLISVVSSFFKTKLMLHIMVFGTLLGSMIGHDLIPWDDDLDLAVYRPDFLKLLDIAHNEPELLKKHNLAYTLNEKNQDKLFFADKPLTPNATWSWPFIDVLWFDQNKTHVWVHDPLEPHVRNVTMKRSDFYPVHDRPLGNLLLKAPGDPVAMLNSTYGESRSHMICTGTLQSHMSKDGTGRTITVPCPEIHGYYPLVWRTGNGKRVKETLFLGNQTIYSINVRGKYHEKFNPFLWEWR